MSDLTQEQQAFINDLSHKMKTQDNRMTAQPYGLVIRTEHEIWGIDADYAENIGLYSHELEMQFETLDEFITHLNENDYLDAVKEIEEMGISRLAELDDYHGDGELEGLNIVVSGYKKELTADSSTGCYEGNFFLTEVAAKHYIEANSHNLRKPDTYGIHLYRNPEMEALYEIIHQLADGAA